MIEQTAVITDSVACLPDDLIRKYGIEVVPIQLIMDGKAYRDGVDIKPDEFYRRLLELNQPPTTAGAVPGAFIEAFKKAARNSKNILCITVSGRLTGIFNAAREARDILQQERPEIKIEILDSGTAAAAQGFVVLAAARALIEGKSTAEALITAYNVSHRVHLVGIVNSLEYLIKSGRVPRAAELANKVLRLKPVFALVGGAAHPVATSRSFMSGIQYLLKLMKRETGDNPVHVAIMHAAAPKEALSLKEAITSRFLCKELFVTEFTPVMGAHTGPGVVAIAFYID